MAESRDICQAKREAKGFSGRWSEEQKDPKTGNGARMLTGFGRKQEGKQNPFLKGLFINSP